MDWTYSGLKRKKPESQLEREFAWWIESESISSYHRQFRFDSKRKWRFDFAFPELKVAVEVEGGLWIGGRHVRASGFEADAEKYNEAVCQGWRVLRVTAGQIKRGEALAWLVRLLSETTLQHLDR